MSAADVPFFTRPELSIVDMADVLGRNSRHTANKLRRGC